METKSFDAMLAYQHKHQCCPKCSTGTITAVWQENSHEIPVEEMPVSCSCGWTGVRDDLTERHEDMGKVKHVFRAVD